MIDQYNLTIFAQKFLEDPIILFVPHDTPSHQLMILSNLQLRFLCLFCTDAAEQHFFTVECLSGTIESKFSKIKRYVPVKHFTYQYMETKFRKQNAK